MRCRFVKELVQRSDWWGGKATAFQKTPHVGSAKARGENNKAGEKKDCRRKDKSSADLRTITKLEHMPSQRVKPNPRRRVGSGDDGKRKYKGQENFVNESADMAASSER